MRIRHETDPILTRLVEPLGVLKGGPLLPRSATARVRSDHPPFPFGPDHLRRDHRRKFPATGGLRPVAPRGRRLLRLVLLGVIRRSDLAVVARSRRGRRRFLFHPRQRMQGEPDGSLRVSLHASGWLEMAWHLACHNSRNSVLELSHRVRHTSGHILESVRSRCTAASEIPLKSRGLGCAERPLPPEP